MYKTIEELQAKLDELKARYLDGLLTEDEFRALAISAIDLFRPEDG